MRKWIALLLAAALCCALGACGGETPAAGSPQQETGQGVQTEDTAKEQTTAVVVHIVVNPEFKIHAGSDGVVFLVECLNEDAKAVCDQVSVTGSSCEDAVALILGESVRQGFLKDGGELAITVFAAEENADQINTWNEAVTNGFTRALGENHINADIAFYSQIMESEQKDASADNTASGTDASDDAAAGTAVDDTAGGAGTNNDTPDTENPAAVDDNGNTVIRNEEDGTVTVIDKNGNMVQVIHTEKDGTVATQDCDASGRVIRESRTHPDGTTVVLEYDENGNVIRNVITQPDGTVIEQENDAAGFAAYPQYAGQTISEANADGEIWTTTYDEKGYPVSAYHEYEDEFGNRWRIVRSYTADGSAETNTCHYINGVWEPRTLYHDNGVVAKDVGVSGHGLTVSYYDRNGRPTEVFSVDDRDNPTHIVYSADGSFVVYTTEKDGSISTVYFDARGNEIHP